ncbi:MAG: class I SAM-dependent methyltransferase, partial [Actinomycetota bacterium]
EIAGEAWGHAALDWANRFEPYNRDAIEHVFNRLRIGPNRTLLDLACGSGYALGRAERLGATTAGLDASAALIAIAGRRAPTSELIVGTMFELPWADDSFDVVTSFNGIWGGCDGAVAEAARVLRPGGSLAVTFWGPGKALDLRDFMIVLGNAAAGAADELKSLASIGAPGAAEAMFDGAGFTVVERSASSAIIEAIDADEIWRTLRSPGVVVPSLEAVGEDELRRRALDAIAPFRADDGSYRLVNEVTTVIGRLR